MHPDRLSDRRSFRITPAVIAFVVGFMVNFGTVVWGVAKMSSAIDSLKEAVVNINVAHEDYETRLRLLESDVAVVKARLFLVEQGVTKR